MRQHRIRSFLVPLVLVLALVVAACSRDSSGDSGAGGSVTVSGSSTVEPISAANAEKFAETNPDVAISVDGPGTGDGFQLFCSGDTDISDASRPIKDEEIATCEDNGIEFVELKVGIDGLSVITSPANDAVECLNVGDLYALIGPESEGFDNWSDADDLGAEVGGSGDYPDSELTITAPGEESGTYDSFVELALEEIAEERDQDAVARADYESSPNDNVIIEGVAGSDTSLGWVGYAFVVENSDSVRVLEIDGGGGCVAPTDETIAAAEFPLARDLFVYVNKEKAADNQAVTDYIDFYLSDAGRASVTEVGYVDLTDEDWQASVAAWEGR
ncbi:MAG: phosphate ABC transporter substrate-binding protein PstS family protein [Acidimicrobiia bacterium]